MWPLPRSSSFRTTESFHLNGVIAVSPGQTSGTEVLPRSLRWTMGHECHQLRSDVMKIDEVCVRRWWVMSHELSPTHLITTSPKLGSWELRSLVNFRSKQSKYWASNFDPWLLGILQTAMPDPSFVPRGRSLESRRWSQQSWCGVGAPGGKKTIQNHPKLSKAHRGLSASVEDFGRYSFNFFYIVLNFNCALNIFITGAEDLRFARQNWSGPTCTKKGRW